MHPVRPALILSIAVSLAACSSQQTPAPSAAAPAPAAPAMSQLERGSYLVKIAGCNDCHTPLKMGANGPEPDMSRELSGHPEGFPLKTATVPEGWMALAAPTMTAWQGPWGTSFTANLTPDQNTGLGVWTEEMFIAALREGKHMGKGRPILPPMPWQMYRQMTDEDLKAVFAYLRSIKPIANRVPDPLPPSGAAQ